MTVQEVASSIQGLSDWSFVEKIKFFAWYLHAYGGCESFKGAEIKACFEQLHFAEPSSIHPFLTAMTRKNPKEVLKTTSGFRLEARVRERFDTLYGQRPATTRVHKILSELPGRISTGDKQKYLDEALICFQNKAFRAAVVMCWNLAFDHLCEHVLNKHLVEFNSQLPKSFPKADIAAVGKRDDFSELKESQVIQVCKSANIISNAVHKILKEKLDRRNIAAHPSGVSTPEPTAEEFIKDLIENVVLKIV